MHMIFRMLWQVLVIGPRRAPLGFTGISRSRFRVWPTDLDVLNHMNNGKYLSIMDVGRFDLLQRNGIWRLFKDQGWYPVVVGQTISYRKSLNPWVRFWIESRILGFDEQAVYLEQRFVRLVRAAGSAGSERSEHSMRPVDSDRERQPEIYARAYVRARILRRAGGVVAVAELAEKCGIDPDELHVPAEVLEWGRMTKLPSTRAEAPSLWE